MIFVTLSTQDKGFERLLKAVDKAIDDKIIKEEVIVQAGYTKYESNKMKIIDFMSSDEYNSFIKDCDILITHGGVGTIITGLKYQKKIIAAPRLKKYKEHTNDHQLQIINKLSKDGYLVKMDNFKDIEKCINKAKKLKVKKFESNTYNIVNIIDDFIEKCS